MLGMQDDGFIFSLHGSQVVVNVCSEVSGKAMGAQQAKEPRPSSSKSKGKTKEPRVSQGNIFTEHSGKFLVQLTEILRWRESLPFVSVHDFTYVFEERAFRRYLCMLPLVTDSLQRACHCHLLQNDSPEVERWRRMDEKGERRVRVQSQAYRRLETFKIQRRRVESSLLFRRANITELTDEPWHDGFVIIEDGQSLPGLSPCHCRNEQIMQKSQYLLCSLCRFLHKKCISPNIICSQTFFIVEKLYCNIVSSV